MCLLKVSSVPFDLKIPEPGKPEHYVLLHTHSGMDQVSYSSPISLTFGRQRHLVSDHACSEKQQQQQQQQQRTFRVDPAKDREYTATTSRHKLAYVAASLIATIEESLRTATPAEAAAALIID